MKKFLLSLLALFMFTCLSVFADNTKSIKFVQVSDAHFSADSDYTQKVLKSAISDINSLQDVSFVVFTGDNVNSPNESNLKAFLKIVKKLKVPYDIAIGDHDVYKANGLSKARYYDMIHEHNWFMFKHQPNYKFKKKSIKIFDISLHWLYIYQSIQQRLIFVSVLPFCWCWKYVW